MGIRQHVVVTLCIVSAFACAFASLSHAAPPLVSGVVVDSSGNPIEGASLHLDAGSWDTRPPDLFTKRVLTTSDPDELFATRPFFIGLVAVGASHPDFAPGYVYIDSDNDNTNLKVVLLRPATITGTTEPKKWISVTFQEEPFGSRRTQADDQGHFEFNNVPPGAFRIFHDSFPGEYPLPAVKAGEPYQEDFILSERTSDEGYKRERDIAHVAPGEFDPSKLGDDTHLSLSANVTTVFPPDVVIYEGHMLPDRRKVFADLNLALNLHYFSSDIVALKTNFGRIMTQHYPRRETESRTSSFYVRELPPGNYTAIVIRATASRVLTSEFDSPIRLRHFTVSPNRTVSLTFDFEEELEGQIVIP